MCGISRGSSRLEGQGLQGRAERGIRPEVDAPQGIRDPRPDLSSQVSGLLADGFNGGGSRVFQWGWNPVGGASGFDTLLTPNNLVLAVEIGTVTVVVT